MYHSLVIAHTLSQRDVQEMLALHNISAAARSQRVRNAGMSIAYNVGVRVWVKGNALYTPDMHRW